MFRPSSKPFALTRTALSQGEVQIVHTAEAYSGRPAPVRDFVPDEGDLERAREPFGAASVALEFGSLKMRLEGLSRVQAEKLTYRFRPFVVAPEQGDPVASIALKRAGVGHFLKARCDGTPETYRLESRRRGDCLELWSYEFAGRLDISSGQAELALVAEAGELFNRGLENFLRVLTSFLILDWGGLLLHASGVVRGGRGGPVLRPP